MQPSDWHLEACGLGRRPRGGDAWLLRDASLDLRPGDRLAITGPSGSGKSLLLRALALIDPLDAGEVRWCGAEVRRDGVPAFRSRVLYLAQRPALFEGSVESNLRRPFELATHRRARFDHGRTCALLAALCREPSFLAKSHRDLSGGEAQLVALIRALQLDPAVLLLDEPTASLDAATARAVEGLLERWLEDAAARAVVWVSHDLAQAARATARQLCMRAGRLEHGA